MNRNRNGEAERLGGREDFTPHNFKQKYPK